MKTILIILSLGLFININTAQELSGKEILDKIDQNMSAKNRVLTSKMVIHGRRSSRTIVSKSWTTGTEKSFTEYLSPAREKGNKMLKLDDKLWIYSPSTDRIIQISGHMLKQSLMGSDLSYEDMMEDEKLYDKYDAVVKGSDTLTGRECYILELIANTPDVNYAKRVIWVDKIRFIPLKEELYAKSGKLLKKTELSKVTKIDNRWFPMKIVFKDMLKKGDGTEFIIETIKFDVDIPELMFSKASLKK